MQITQHGVPLQQAAAGQGSLYDELANASWQVPGRYDPAILIPGFSISFLVQVTGRCHSTVVRWKKEVSGIVPQSDVQALMQNLSPADGMLMSRVRGSAQMPFWSRLAAIEYRKRGFSVRAIAAAFNCSPRTVFYISKKSVVTQIDRRLTEYQLNPPSKK